MSLVRVVSAPWPVGSRRPFVFEAVPADVARRIEAGEVGDLHAHSGYVARANRVAAASLTAAGVAGLLAALSQHYVWGVVTVLCGLGAILD